MAAPVKLPETNKKEIIKVVRKTQESKPAEPAAPSAQGVIYSKQLNFCPFSTQPLESYAKILGAEKFRLYVPLL